MSLAVRVSIAGSAAVIGSSLKLGHSSSLPVEEACASSRMGFRAPESPKESFVVETAIDVEFGCARSGGCDVQFMSAVPWITFEKGPSLSLSSFTGVLWI